MRGLLVGLIALFTMLWVIVQPALAQEGRSERFPYTTEFINPCNGELVTVEGVVHVVIPGTEDKAGGVHGAFLQGQHATGTGESGAKYVLNEQIGSRGSFSPNGADGGTITTQAHFLRQGNTGSDDLVGRQVITFRFDANDRLTADVAFFDTECR